MQVFRRLPPAGQRRPCALTIGNFDGVHRGHQAILARLGSEAARLGLPSCVLTFEPNPREFFAARGKGQAPARISTLRDKLEALAQYGIERVDIAHFGASLAACSAESFIEDILVGGLQLRYLLVGDDFRFGAQRRGDFAMLSRFASAKGFELASVATVSDEFGRISSSAVRQALDGGDLRRAEDLIGRPYSISGHVVHGRKLGRDFGFPTLNLRLPFAKPAASGIFVVRVHGLAGQALPGVASLGTRPAVEPDGRPLLEVHLFDFAQDVYGRLVRVEFVHKLRDEQPFETLDLLKAQIARDAQAARDYFSTPAQSSAAP